MKIFLKEIFDIDGASDKYLYALLSVLVFVIIFELFIAQ